MGRLRTSRVGVPALQEFVGLFVREDQLDRVLEAGSGTWDVATRRTRGRKITQQVSECPCASHLLNRSGKGDECIRRKEWRQRHALMPGGLGPRVGSKSCLTSLRAFRGDARLRTASRQRVAWWKGIKWGRPSTDGSMPYADTGTRCWCRSCWSPRCWCRPCWSPRCW